MKDLTVTPDSSFCCILLYNVLSCQFIYVTLFMRAEIKT